MSPSKRKLCAVTALGVAATMAFTTAAGADTSPGPGSVEASQETPIYLDPDYAPAERAADLVSRMTLEEKASQMNASLAAAIPRLGVAEYSWWNEAAHGVAREGRENAKNPDVLWNTTSYPVSLSLGSTWNPELMYDEATEISDEAREVVEANSLNLNFYSPTINLARDPRWGRNDEAYSEDPFLTTAMGSSFVQGMEGKDQDGELLEEGGGYLKTLTTLKHYAANNSEYNRRTGTSDMDDRTLREYYTAQFRDVVEQADPASIMTSYNRVNGVPTTASVYLIDNLARQTFGFDGFFTSDCDSIMDIQRSHNWQPPNMDRPVNEVERHAYALMAGLDLDCNQGHRDEFNYANILPGAVDDGIVTEAGVLTEAQLDVAVTRLFTKRIELGEFDDVDSVPWVQQARERVPEWTDGEENGAITQTEERLALAREAATQAIVLLENDGEDGPLLPLEVPETGDYRVAVVGHYADPDELFLGGYSSQQSEDGQANHVSGYEGLQAAITGINPDAEVDYIAGIDESLATIDTESLAGLEDYDVALVYVGTDSRHADESGDRSGILLPGAQNELVELVAAANDNTVVYIESIGQMDVTSFVDDVDALLWSSYNGQRKGEALADVLLGEHNPTGHLPFTWYETEEQLPELGDYAIRPEDGTQGRTYMYFEGDPAYPFGYGRSYTDFEYSNVNASASSVDANGTVEITAEVRNAGEQAGTDVVQLYVATPDSPAELERPIKRLAGFERVTVAPGPNSDLVRFEVDVADLAFFDEESGRYVVDQGTYEFQVASSSGDVAETVAVEVSGELASVPSVVTAKPRTAADAEADVPERVLFEAGDVIDPQLTVGMSDDQLFGYVAAGESTDLPEGMDVSFESNRPTVVSTEGGELRALGGGVATVTATVTQDGAEATGTFVVHVDGEPYVPPTEEPTDEPTTPGDEPTTPGDEEPTTGDDDATDDDAEPGAGDVDPTDGAPGADRDGLASTGVSAGLAVLGALLLAGVGGALVMRRRGATA